MSRQLADLPNEVLEKIIAPLYDGQRSTWRTSLLCIKLFHHIALHFQYNSLVLTPVNIACFPLLPRLGPHQHDCAPFNKTLQESDADVSPTGSHHSRRPSFEISFESSSCRLDHIQQISHKIRHLTLELPGFACAARLRGFCAAPYTHVTIDKTKLYVRHADYVAHLNHCLCSLAAQLPKLKMLKSFRIKAYRGRPYYSCTEDRPFLAETTVIKLIQGLQQCKELETLVVDLTDAEEIVGSMALEERFCAEHSCFVISQTVASLPKLKALSLRKREMCPGCLDFLSADAYSCHAELDACSHSLMPRSAPTSSLERVIIDLRIPDWQIISSNTYEARVRPCNYICHCSTCSNKRSPPSPPETSSQLPPNPSSNLPNTRTLNKLLSAVFPLTTENIANSNSADYQPWPTAHQPPPAAAPAPVPIPTNFLPYYHPATPNIHLHWMVQHNTHPTNPATNNNSNQTAAGQAYIGAETEILARRDQLESFLHPLLRSTADQHGVLRKAREVKILVNANPGAACDNRCRGGVSVDCLRERVVDLCGGDGVDGEAKAKAQREEAIEVDCEGTALRAFMAGSRRC